MKVNQTIIANYLAKFTQTEIIIFGLGTEGISTYTFLREAFPAKKLWLLDEKSVPFLDDFWKQVQKNDKNANFLTVFPQEKFQQETQILCVKSPGIPPKNKPLQELKKQENIQFTSNTELFFTLIELTNSAKTDKNKQIVTVGITGTKGKSTTSALISHVLTTAQLHSFLGGNIGVAPLTLLQTVLETAEQNATHFPIFVVLELSCHQLNDIQHSPHYAVILDITPEHLDYYATFDEYVEAKSRICLFQSKRDFAIFNPHLPIPKTIAQQKQAQPLHFSYEDTIQNNWITVDAEQILDLDTLPLLGKHTITNALPSVILAKHLGIKNQHIALALKTFKSLPHRLELIVEDAGISYYNDSLSTTPVATIEALSSFGNRPIILIAGGYDRGLDYSQLGQVIADRQVKHLILFPDTGEAILRAVQKHSVPSNPAPSATRVASMKDAVAVARKYADSGDVILLSPASASFNLFENYEDRGNQFRECAVADSEPTSR